MSADVQTVYVVLAHFTDHDNILGVFATEAKAQRYASNTEREFSNQDPEPEVYVQTHEIL